MTIIKTHTLPNGLRIIARQQPTAAVYCGYVVCSGTRHEDLSDSGMAHFIEHLTFKGTSRRKSWQIASTLERVGGDLNAYTTKQETVFHAAVLPPDFSRAADLLTDIVFHSTFPQSEIDKEVEVICDEIDSYKDSPAELIFDEFESMMFRRHPLGRDILGDKVRLHEYTTADALRFTHTHYRPENLVFFLSGNISMERIIRTLQTHFDRHPLPLLPPYQPLSLAPLPPYEPEVRIVERGTHQAHVLLGNRTFGGRDPRRHAMVLLNNMLGGPGMSSRLNTALRERAGLVYSVDAYLSTYKDAGFWHVYFGCDPKDVNRCCRLIRRELRRFVETPLTPRQLQAAKKQFIGQMGISNDNAESFTLGMAKIYAHYGDIINAEQACKNILAITAEELQSVAQSVFDENLLSTLIYQ